MIGKLSGTIDSIDEDHLILDVNGVGYLIYTPEILNFQLNEKVVLHIETHVREDAINLYGFSNLSYKSCFVNLVNVNGIGPKAALNILAKLPPEKLQHAILMKDLLAFKQISGVGTKLAERIILELQNKTLFKHGNLSLQGNTDVPKVDMKSHNIFNDAIAGLINLGINYAEASTLVHSVLSSSKDVAEAISNALRLRGSKK